MKRCVLISLLFLVSCGDNSSSPETTSSQIETSSITENSSLVENSSANGSSEASSVAGLSEASNLTPNAIGSMDFNYIDSTREEILTSTSDDYRDMFVKIYYPANVTAEQKPSHIWHYSEDHPIPVAKNDAGYANTLASLQKIESKTYPNATPALNNNPVVFYSHGYVSNGVQNQLLFEELVSRGFVVVSVSHNYQANFMVQADTTSTGYVYSDRKDDFFLSPEADVNADALNAEIEALIGKDLTQEQKDRTLQLFSWCAGDQKWINYWAEDVRSVKKLLEEFASEGNASKGIFRNSLKIESIAAIAKGLNLNAFGMLGSSMGGTVAMEFCNSETNCKGAVNMDSWHYNLNANTKMGKPYLYLIREGGISPGMRIIMDRQKSDIFAAVVAGTKHVNFTDGSLIMPSWFDLGTIDGQRMIDIMTGSVGRFFSNYLDGNDSAVQFVDWMKAQKEITLDYQL